MPDINDQITAAQIDQSHHGHAVRTIREALGISQTILGQKAFMDQSMVSRYEMLKIINIEVLEKFATALNVPLKLLQNLPEESTISFGFNNQECHIGNIVNGTIHNPDTTSIIMEMAKQGANLQGKYDNLKKENDNLKKIIAELKNNK